MTLEELIIKGIVMGLDERQRGFLPVYVLRDGEVMCDEYGWVRPIGTPEERTLAMAYIRGYESLSKEIN